MSTNFSHQNGSQTTRRQFLKTSSLAAATSGAIAGALGRPAMVHAAGSDQLTIGLIGCGGRGTGAAIDALKVDDDVQLTAMADVFEDRLESSLETLKKNSEISSKLNVPEDRQFVGFDAFQQLIDSGVDVVLLATPPHFRPLHLRAAVDAGKHISTFSTCVLGQREAIQKKRLVWVGDMFVRRKNTATFSTIIV